MVQMVVFCLTENWHIEFNRWFAEQFFHVIHFYGLVFFASLIETFKAFDETPHP